MCHLIESLFWGLTVKNWEKNHLSTLQAFLKNSSPSGVDLLISIKRLCLTSTNRWQPKPKPKVKLLSLKNPEGNSDLRTPNKQLKISRLRAENKKAKEALSAASLRLQKISSATHRSRRSSGSAPSPSAVPSASSPPSSHCFWRRSSAAFWRRERGGEERQGGAEDGERSLEDDRVTGKRRQERGARLREERTDLENTWQF